VVPDVGSEVAGYRIVALVSRGGGGVVYRAKHLSLDRTVALKLLAPELAADPEFQRRFKREAKMAAELEHPYIIPVYDAGNADGVLYLAMRFVEGSDLATVIKSANGRLDPTRTCTILSQVASALDAAHAKGLVHRDVKPKNILMDRVGDGDRERAYLSDFGLTRRFEGTAWSSITLAGTPLYMAPERFHELPSEPAIDVYALGCVAYACLIGSPPFTFESVMTGHLQEPPRVSDHRDDLPAGVDTILAKAIAKKPADRYPSCSAFAAALQDEIHAGAALSPATGNPPAPAACAYIVQGPRVPTLLTWITPRRKIVGVAAVAAVLVAALVAFAVLRIGTSTPPPRLIGRVDALTIDPAGGVYVGTNNDSQVLEVEPSGTIRTVAGADTKGYSGDNGPATKAQLWNPRGLALDNAGNLYIADTNNHRIRKIDSAGTITTVAGNGTQNSTGDDGPASLAQFRFPVGVALDRSRNLYIAEADGHRVRKIDQSGHISTVAGTGVAGFSGDGGPATRAQLGVPLGIAVDDSGNLYIADADNNRIRKVDTAGTITSIAGNGVEGFAGDGGLAVAAELSYPEGVTVDHAGSLYIADSGNDRIRKVDTGGRINTIVGSGIRGFSGDGEPAATAQLAYPDAVAVDRHGDVYIGDWGNYRVRKVDQNGTITTLAGLGPNYPDDGGPSSQAILRSPTFAHVDNVGRLYIADSGNHRVRRVDQGGDITTIAGNGTAGFSGDGGPAIDAQLNDPISLALDPAGNVYIADTLNHRVRKVTPDGKITTIAGTGRGFFFGDNGPATEADLHDPRGLAVGGDGSLYIAEGGGDRIRRVDPTGIITTVAGNGTRGFSGDGGPATQAQLFAPAQIQLDPDGNLYIADAGNNMIRRVDRTGIITTVAGNGAKGFSGDGGPAHDAQLNNVSGVAVNDAGNLYIADTGNNRIRKVDTSGRIATIAGTGDVGIAGDGGPATRAQLNKLLSVSVGADGAVYIADGNNRIRKIDAAGIITTFAGLATNG
jgi:sugar lactone lactonase YvrE